jgi:pimeloyl-ACP methyl ester carboxylesterase
MMPLQLPWVGSALNWHGQPYAQLQWTNSRPLIDHSVSVIGSSATTWTVPRRFSSGHGLRCCASKAFEGFAEAQATNADRLGQERLRLLGGIFSADGAHPYKRDLPDVEFHVLDTGHFAPEHKADEIVPLIRDFLERQVARVS